VSEELGVQVKDPELGIPVTIVENRVGFVIGPKRRIREMALNVVGCHVMEKGLHAGTIYKRH
jgi:hypothetical protein